MFRLLARLALVALGYLLILSGLHRLSLALPRQMGIEAAGWIDMRSVQGLRLLSTLLQGRWGAAELARFWARSWGWSALARMLLGALLVRWACRRRRARRAINAFHQRMRRHAQAVAKKLPQLKTPGAQFALLRRMNPFAFEELLLDAFERQGHRVHRNTRYTGDGGIDGAVDIGGKHYLIQAKRYRGAINPAHVADFAQILQARRCDGFFCHTGRTPEAAWEIARRYPRVTMLSGRQLLTHLIGRG